MLKMLIGPGFGPGQAPLVPIPLGGVPGGPGHSGPGSQPN